jgi:hypothetical protein
VTAAIIQRKHTNKLYNFPITAAGRCENLSHMCIKYMREPKGIIQLLNYNHNAPGAYFLSVIPQWDAPRERLYCMRFSFFSAHCYCLDRVCMCCVRWATRGSWLGSVCVFNHKRLSSAHSLPTTGPFVRGLCSLYAWLVICYHLINIARRIQSPLRYIIGTLALLCDRQHCLFKEYC